MNLPHDLPLPETPSSTGWPWTAVCDPEKYAGSGTWPKISIITPSYNQGHYLEQTIRSVLLQQYPNLEYIVIDGGSKDNSVAVIRKYSPWLHFWVSEPDAGQTDALQKGFALATGEIIAWINSDDFYDPGSFYRVASLYRKTGFTFLCGACRMIDPDGCLIRELYTRQVSYQTLIRYWQPHFCPPQPSIFFQRAVLDVLGDLDVSLHYAMDFDLWLRASKQYTFTHIRDNISFYRVHTDSKTGSTGGLGKFVPEWKMLIGKSLRQESLLTQWRYHTEELGFRMRRAIRRILAGHDLKRMLK